MGWASHRGPPCIQLGWRRRRKQTPTNVCRAQKLQFHKPPLYLLTYKVSDMRREISLLTVLQAQILTQGFCHSTVKWVCVSTALPCSSPRSLCVSLWNTGKTNNAAKWPLCVTVLDGWKEGLFCGRSSSHAAVFTGHWVLRGSSRSGSEGGDRSFLCPDLNHHPLLLLFLNICSVESHTTCHKMWTSWRSDKIKTFEILS